MSDGVGRAVAGGGSGAGLVSPGMPRLSRWRPSRPRQVSLLSRAEPPGHTVRPAGLRAAGDVRPWGRGDVGRHGDGGVGPHGEERNAHLRGERDREDGRNAGAGLRQ